MSHGGGQLVPTYTCTETFISDFINYFNDALCMYAFGLLFKKVLYKKTCNKQ